MASVSKDFLSIWGNRFAGAEAPLTFRFVPDPGSAEPMQRGERWRCWIADLKKARSGRALAFSDGNFACSGASCYTGFSNQRTESFPFFISTGVPGGREGERYKQSPALVEEWMQYEPQFRAPSPWLVVERMDLLADDVEPHVVLFYATPDELSGLFSWANFHRAEPNGVISPWGAGCAGVIQWPMSELDQPQPRAVMGLVDISARLCVPSDRIGFAVPWPLLVTMVATAPETFLYTSEWERVMRRMARRSSLATAQKSGRQPPS